MTEEERFYVSGPEEGDEIDRTVLICDAEGIERIEIRAESVALSMLLGRKIAQLLNRANAEVLD